MRQAKLGVHEGIPFILTQELTPSMQDGKIVVTSTSSTMNNRLKGSASEHVYRGVFADVLTLVSAEALSVPRASLVQTAQFLVEYQISKTPTVSGYPVEVVEITAEGKVTWFHWDDPQAKQRLPAVRWK